MPARMIGQGVGSYRITGKLGEGGMGVVYLAEHRLLGKQAVVKVLLPELSSNKELVARFFNEARAATQIKHPGIVDVFDFGHAEDGSAYIAMELLEGQTLTARIKAPGRLGVAGTVAVGRQIASALAAAHDKGIVHRDLKPDNIFLLPDPDLPGGVRVKVLDFGIAKLTGEGGAHLKTRTGAIMGTPAYMSPEQCRDTGDVDARSDIYALGCVLYEMALGRTPFVSQAFGELIVAHLTETPPSPRSLDPALPEALEGVILRALAKRPDERQQTMAELKAELDAAGGVRPTGQTPELRPVDLAVAATLHGAEIASVPTRGPSTTLSHSAAELGEPEAPARRRGLVYGVGAAAVLTLGAGVVWFALPGRVPRPHPAPVPTPTLLVSPKVETAPPAAAVVAPKAIPEKAIKQVRLRIESEPQGASIHEAKDGAKVGVTPKDIDLALAEGVVEFTLRLPGYHSEKVKLPADRDGAVRAKLVKESPGAKPQDEAGDEAKPLQKKRVGDSTFNPFGQ